MNLIKFKDVKAPEGVEWAELFNEHLKGKYAYWVHMRYVVPFEYMSHHKYTDCEEDISKLLNGNIPYLDTYERGVLHCADSVETDSINSIKDFKRKNDYVCDKDITLDELRVFRTWLAKELLEMDQTESGEQKHDLFTTQETHVLKYYANDMYDDTVSILNEFGVSHVTLNDISTSSGCNCHPTSNLSALYEEVANPCDTVALYKLNIYRKMVSMFSVVDRWSKLSPEFILTFKKYIENIVRVGLPLEDCEYNVPYADCGCVGMDTHKNEDILKRLAIALQYIYDNDINGHKNYIYDALNDWASALYQKMRW